MDEFLCNECIEVKDRSEFYKHPGTKDGILHKCKSCIKDGRKAERELEMSRIRDRNRFMNNPKRRAYVLARSNSSGIRTEKDKIRQRCSDILRHRNCRPKKCSVCKFSVGENDIRRIEFHHFDYSKGDQGIFCCPVCHRKLDMGKLNYKKYRIYTLSYTRNPF